MKTVNYEIGYENAVRFAEANSIELKTLSLEYPESLQSFNIEGYSKLVKVYRFVRYIDVFTRELSPWYFENQCVALQILATGELFRFWQDKSRRYELLLFDPAPLNHVQNFRYEEPKPSLIGSATIKKIDAWVSYLHMKETARHNHNNAAILRNKVFADKFRAKFPEVKFREMKDGWVSYFTIKKDAFYFTYTSDNDGVFSRQVSLIYKNVPTDEELLS